MFRIALMLAAAPLLAAPKPWFEIQVNQQKTPTAVNYTYTLINNSGRRIVGCEVAATFDDARSVTNGVSVTEFPAGTDTAAKRIPIPGSHSFSPAQGWKPKPRLVSVRFAEGDEWRAAPEK